MVEDLKSRFLRTRELTEMLASELSDADASVQAMADASPAKWHLAHTTWFFETFVLREYVEEYRVFDPRYHFLFNSYYEAEGPRLARALRGLLTPPSLDELRRYRMYVTGVVARVFGNLPDDSKKVIELGCHHEEQHQELLQTDVLYLFAQNPLAPRLWPMEGVKPAGEAMSLTWVPGADGVREIGHAGQDFAFDSETPRHKVWLAPHALANRLVTNLEWLEFIRDGGYRTPALWLSDGWTWVRKNSIESPLHWQRNEDSEFDFQFGLDGISVLQQHVPVRHISYYEADAFARWAGARLATEAEWESAAEQMDPTEGGFLVAPGPVAPLPAERVAGLQQMFGQLWQWTSSSFLPYPGFRAAPGAVGEYNGKFMSGQSVLRGGSCATPKGHMRASYRNFFYPHQRWQFTGVRLAKNL